MKRCFNEFCESDLNLDALGFPKLGKVTHPSERGPLIIIAKSSGKTTRAMNLGIETLPFDEIAGAGDSVHADVHRPLDPKLRVGSDVYV